MISVVIPTYEPGRFLVDSINSVLTQDMGPAHMQIAIVDDGSTCVRPSDLLAATAPAGRIEYHEHAARLGLAGNWNRAIEQARGEFIHILHQDDTVAPGFYARLLFGLRTRASIGMAFCRHAFVDEHEQVERISHRERWRAGVLPHWLERISERQRIQCPSVIVRRNVYEKLGGFRPDLHYALDWEMWVRIASAYDVWYEPRVLARYRRHSGAETARLEAAGRTTTDMIAAIHVISMHAPPAQRARVQQRAYERLVRLNAKRAAKLLKARQPQLAANQLEAAQKALSKLPENLMRRWLSSRLARIELQIAGRTAEPST